MTKSAPLPGTTASDGNAHESPNGDSYDFLLLLGNHLYAPGTRAFSREMPVLMVEDSGICGRHLFHQQKLALVLSAMRNQAAALKANGCELHYVDLTRAKTIESAIREFKRKADARRFATFTVNDHRMRRRLHRMAEATDLDWVELEDPAFLTSPAQLRTFFDGARKPRMDTFYRWQRQRLGVLMTEGGKPAGGQWSFDTQNRRKLPARQAVPELPVVDHPQITVETQSFVATHFPANPGSAFDLWLPTEHEGARRWLDRFVEERLIGFGTYEDAISQRTEVLFHSVLSPLLNLGLLLPGEVLDAALARTGVPLNDLEGFVRQIIGWREFVRGCYLNDQTPETLGNHRAHGRSLTRHWYNGTTGIPPLDHAIRTMLKLGWNHHIERLMVLANLMNLCEIKPSTVYDYFMAHYVDAYPWVMKPNIEDMGLTSNADSFATKPYICGSNYLLKMSDFKRGAWCDVVDGLYWRFVDRNRHELAANPRAALMPKNLDRMDSERRVRLFAAAESFLAQKTELA